MAGPSNPFSGLGQKNAVAGSAGRGRGGSSQGQNAGAPHDSKPRGRGGARGARGGRGRGKGRGGGGAPAGNTGPNKPGSSAGPSQFAPSPFAQLHPLAPKTPFGGLTSQPGIANDPFAGFGKKPAVSFGVSSPIDATMADSQPSPKLTNGAIGSAPPVEDAQGSNSYHERYEQLKLDRAKEREEAIRKGQMADPNQPTSLNQAITPVGTCTSMCPEFERVERIVQKMVDKSEKFLHPSTNSLQNMETKMLKRFRRSAAGYDEQLPSDIRTPKTLLQTVNYLTRHVIGGPEPLGLIHKFVWDRTRSVRNDFSVQQLTQEDDVKIAVTCLERIARFHILSLHLLSSPTNEEPFDRHQEREQLNNTMLSLMYYYDDNRGRITFPNEDEFRAYYIIISIHDQRPDLEARVQKWPAVLRNSPRVQVALELLAAAGNTWEYQGTLDAKRPNAIAQGFYSRFFNLVDSPGVSYLMACVAEIYFNHMRQTAIRSIWKGYCRYPSSQQHKNEEWTVSELTTVLCFDDDDQTITFCQEQDLEFAENANGDLYLNWGSRPIESVAFQPSSEHSFSDTYVESKRAGRSMVAIILGLNIKEAATLGMIDTSFLSHRTSASPAPDGGSTDDNSLFVSYAGSVATPSNQPKEDMFSQSPASDSSLRNALNTMPQSPSSAGPSQTTNLFSQAPSTSQPTEANAAPTTFFPAPAAPSPNPFSSLSSPKTEANKSSSIFPAAPTAQQSVFGPPAASTSQQSTSIFPAAPYSSASQKVNGESSTFTSTAPSQPSSLFPSNTPSTKPLFNFPPTSSDAKPNQNTGLTAGQTSSIFDQAKAPTVPGNPQPIFSFPSQSTSFGGTSTKQPQATPSKPPGNIFSASAASLPTPSAPSNDDEHKISFSQPSTGPFSSMFKTDGMATPTEQEKPTDYQKVASTAKEQTAPVSAEQQVLVSNDNAIPKEKFPIFQDTPRTTGSVAAAASEMPGKSDHTNGDLPLTVKPAADEQLIASEKNERREAWIKALREAAEKRRRTSSTSRKRVLDDDPEQAEPVETGFKPTKVSKPEKPTPRQKSMALSSMKPLPKLPILEQIEAMTKRKPRTEPKPEPPKPSHVDEDELLLSSARIAAESLRSGPRISDGWTTAYEPRSSAFSPQSSYSSSLSFSRSQSPQSSHGHDVAFAPDADLGLGRTMSRTEQRLRMTGGKGLAYKPLKFNPEKQQKTK